MPKTRTLICTSCRNTWEEEVRPGAQPWECPACNPRAAKRREAERRRAADRPKTHRHWIEVSDVMADSVQGALRVARTAPPPDRAALAQQVRRVADAQGHLALREELQKLAGICLLWSMILPKTDRIKEVDRDLAA